MNKLVHKLRLKDTRYTNPHGLADKGNHSTANDQCILAYHCLKDPLFQTIVNTIKYECITYLPKKSTDNPEQVEEIPFKMIWNNSNKLLQLEGFCGVKTGITQTAGPCLCLLYQCIKNPQQKILTVVLGCKNIDYRWKDARKLALWADYLMSEKVFS